MGNPIKLSGSISTFQNLDGSNFSLAGIDNKYSFENGYTSFFWGCATDFKGEEMLVADVKGGFNYDKNGYVNQNVRMRYKGGKQLKTLQFRYSPASLNVPVGETTSIYFNPHYVGQHDFKTGKWTNSAGAFLGVKQNINEDATISLEAQRYNLQDIKDNSGKNWGVNAIFSWNF